MIWSATRTCMAIMVLICLAGCAAISHGAMNAAGPVAAAERQVYLDLAVVLIFVAGPVLVLAPIMAWHYRLGNKHNSFRTEFDLHWWVEALIWLPPSGIVIGLSVLVWTSTHQLDPYRPLAATPPPLEIQAVALDWKWLFIYPREHVATVNVLAIPTGRPVRISLTSGTVMQSMLIPRLAGQIYAMPGMQTQLNLAADQPGSYDGANVQYNGVGFAQQHFAVNAMPTAAYQRWLAWAKSAKHPLDTATVAQLYKQSTATPVAYSSVPDGLFQALMTKDQAPNPMKSGAMHR